MYPMPETTDPLSILLVSFRSVLPAFGWIALGMVTRRLIPASLALFRHGEKFVFYLGMPIVLALSAAQLDFLTVKFSGQVLAGVIAFTLVVGAAYLHARRRGFSRAHSGVVAQAAYRSNLAIIGLALCATAFGPQGLVVAAMPTAVWTLLFNVIAVILLGHTHGGHSSPVAVLLGMVKNPLIIGIAAGALVSVSGIDVAATVFQSGDRFSGLVIPFALICLGGSISLQSARSAGAELATASVWRLLVAPATAILVGLAFGLRGLELGVTFLLLGGPAAVASHVMVSAMGGNGRLAANIVMVTTLLAPFSLSLGLFVLHYLSLLEG